MLDARIAIWKKNLFVVVIAAIIWMVNGAFLILGECLS